MMNKNLPAWIWTLIAALLVILIGFFDWVTGYDLDFFLSYFIPVSLVAWFIGLRTAIAVGFLCTIVWFTAELLSGQASSFYFYFAWNTLVRLVSFLIIGTTISKIRQLLDHQRKLSEDLRRSLTKYRMLYDSTSEAVMLMDETGFIDCNEATLKVFGIATREEFFSKHPVDFSPAVQPCGTDSLTLSNRHFAEALANGKTQFEWLHVRTDNGETFYADVRLTAVMQDEKPFFQAILHDITVHKEAERALKESEAKYRRITENMSGIIAEIDSQGIIKYLSPSHTKIFGDNPEKLIGETVFDHIHPEDRDRVMAELLEGVRLRENREAEYRYRHANGHYIWVRSTSNAFFNPGGEILGAVINTNVITERKKAEEALRKSEAKFREVYESIDDIYFETDADENIGFLSPSVYRMTGYREEEIIGKPVTSIYVHPEENTGLYQKLLERGAVNDYEILIKKREKDPWYASLTAHLVFDEKGDPIGARGLLRDITARKQTEESLRQSEAKFREVFETIDDVYFETNPDGKVVNLSPSVRRVAGWTEEDLRGKHYTFVYAKPEDKERLLDKMAQTGHVNDHELLLQKKDGKTFFASITARQFYDEKGQPIGVRGLLRNISERKMTEEQIRYMATHDSLTDLPSLRLANDRLSMALSTARRDQALAAVMFMDLDGFKKVNDTLGHDAGDYVLKQVARRLLSLVRETDTVARVGGDEFLLIATRLHTSKNASLLAEKIIHLLSEPFLFHGQTALIGVSIGIAVYPDHGEDGERLIKHADEAMYAIKNSGKNGYSFARPLP